MNAYITINTFYVCKYYQSVTVIVLCAFMPMFYCDKTSPGPTLTFLHIFVAFPKIKDNADF